jgi:hypothetical protein
LDGGRRGGVGENFLSADIPDYIETTPMKQTIISLLGLAGAMLAVFGVTAGALAESIPILSSTTVGSYNWSGYAVVPSSTAVQSVQGSWAVPAVNSGVTPSGWSCTWVGIDGVYSSTVEQIGTMSLGSAAAADSSLPQYFAWFEMYPGPLTPIPGMTITPGNNVSAQVVYEGSNVFYLAIEDHTMHVAAWTYEESDGTVARSSAEWVVEAPTGLNGILPLADFGSETFTGASTTLDTGQSYEINGLPNYCIDMLTPQWTLLATTSPLDPTGSMFTVVSDVPEPSTLALLGCGALAGLAVWGRRLRRG